MRYKLSMIFLLFLCLRFFANYVISKDYLDYVQFDTNIALQTEEFEEVFKQAIVFYEEAFYDEAFKAFSKLLNSDSDNAFLLNAIGCFYGGVGQYDIAINLFKNAIDLYPRYTKPYYNLGITFTFLEKYYEAVEYYIQTIELDSKYKNLPYHFDDVLINDLKPSKAEEFYKAGFIAHAKNKEEAATSLYLKALELNTLIAEQYFYLDTNEVAPITKKHEAPAPQIIETQKVDGSEPEKTTTFYENGLSYLNQKMYDNAIDYFTKAIEADPENSLAYYGLGKTYYAVKLYYKAINAYLSAIQADPQFSNAYYELGQSYAMIEMYEDAIDAYLKVIEIDPKDSSSLTSIGMIYYNQGVAFSKRGMYNEAIKAFLKTIKFYPEYANTYYLLGKLYYDKKNDPIKAEKMLIALEVLDQELYSALYGKIF
ncbi:MAG: hypothetical protein PWQ84_1945 [Thermotogaceae bacterium]|jgi:tetratricopeptide (TPR) repeat protein|nr:hypothetical protein [Thermotogaceae bacterium]